MTRSGYSYDYEHMNLYRNAVERAIAGKRGQVFFKDLLVALDAMPEKRLISDELVNDQGEVCALGCLGWHRKLDAMEHVDVTDRDVVGQMFGIAPSLAAEVTFLNDEVYSSATPEERFQRMRGWVMEHIGPEE